MTQQEMRDKYSSLYDFMATSKTLTHMKTFGEVENEMMEWMIKNQPSLAEQWIEKLCAIRWNQYLTKMEATKIVNSMEPKAAWTYDSWESALQKLGLEEERPYIFNKYALWVAMNQVYSDFGTSLARLANIATGELLSDNIIPTIHSMALDLLLDVDGRYNIRKYFLS